jgi:hypothetical protein
MFSANAKKDSLWVSVPLWFFQGSMPIDNDSPWIFRHAAEPFAAISVM